MLEHYLNIVKQSYLGYSSYLWFEITKPSWGNYFYYLIGISLFVMLLEVVFPWRKKQAIIGGDFWRNVFYMFFNFFLFSLIICNALSDIGVNFFKDFLALFGIRNLVAIEISSWPLVLRFFIMFLIADFVQWLVHLMLHKVNWLWRFHQVHHSVTEMNFSAHLRFHWMEKIIYGMAKYIPLTIIGYGLDDLFLLHAFNILVGHLNHANLNWDYGPLKYIFNSPAMHIWHHAKKLPAKYSEGVNFGITLSIWDYIFGTAYVPRSGKDISLGFDGIDQYPKSFLGQMKHPFLKVNKKSR